MLALLLLFACAQDIVVAIDQVGCRDYDFEDPGESTLGSAWAGELATVWRTGVIVAEDAAFDPVIETEGDVLHVREAWTAGTAEDFCYEPTLNISGIVSGLEVRWYTDDAVIPFSTAVLEPQ